MAFNLGFQEKLILKIWCMLSHSVGVSLMFFVLLFQIHSAYCVLESSSTDTTFLSCIENRKYNEHIFDCLSLSASCQAHSILKICILLSKFNAYFEILTSPGFTRKYASPSWTGENRSLTVDEIFSNQKRDNYRVTTMYWYATLRLSGDLGRLILSIFLMNKHGRCPEL